MPLITNYVMHNQHLQNEMNVKKPALKQTTTFVYFLISKEVAFILSITEDA